MMKTSCPSRLVFVSQKMIDLVFLLSFVGDVGILFLGFDDAADDSVLSSSSTTRHMSLYCHTINIYAQRIDEMGWSQPHKNQRK